MGRMDRQAVPILWWGGTLKNPHGHGEGKPLSLSTHKGTHPWSQKPSDTCAGKLACGLHTLSTTQHLPQQRKSYCCS